jgi:peptide deformylase
VAEEKGEVRQEELDAHAAALRRRALAQIRQYPDPVLRLAARDVERFDGDLERLVARMTALMTDANGIGLAATQVGILQRVFVFRPDDEDEAMAVVNPRLVEQSDELEVDEEGCLSLQGVLVPVERRRQLTLEGVDVTGAELRLELSGLGARVAQHELDHLEGVLILDRTTAEGRREALAVLRPRLELTDVG